MVTTSKTRRTTSRHRHHESIGYVFPLTTSGAAANLPMPATLCDMSGAGCAFGPIGIPEEDFKKLAKLKKIQFVWGDNRPEDYTYVIQSRQCAALINAYGGNAEVLVGDILASIARTSCLPTRTTTRSRICSSSSRSPGLMATRATIYDDDDITGIIDRAEPVPTGR
jgi:hypothetical protein